MKNTVILELCQPLGKSLSLIIRSPVLRGRFHNIISIFCQIHAQNFTVNRTDLILVGRHGDDKRRNLILPQNPLRRNVHRSAHRSLAAYRTALLLIPDGLQRTVGTGISPHPVTDHTLFHPGHHLPDPAVKI